MVFIRRMVCGFTMTEREKGRGVSTDPDAVNELP